jgi:hypothetical protein
MFGRVARVVNTLWTHCTKICEQESWISQGLAHQGVKGKQAVAAVIIKDQQLEGLETRCWAID